MCVVGFFGEVVLFVCSNILYMYQKNAKEEPSINDNLTIGGEHLQQQNYRTRNGRTEGTKLFSLERDKDREL